jgi:hypothetical protein
MVTAAPGAGTAVHSISSLGTIPPAPALSALSKRRVTPMDDSGPITNHPKFIAGDAANIRTSASSASELHV